MARSSISRREVLGSMGVAAGVGLGGMAVRVGSAAAQAAERPRLPMVVAALQKLDEPYAKRVRDVAPGVTLVNGGKEAHEAAGEANVIFGSRSPEQIVRSPHLHWLHVNSAGVEHVLSPAVVEHDVTITCCKGCHGPQIAEHGLALLLSLTRQLPLRQAPEQRRGLIELRGMTMGIIGLGGIGRELARRAKAMDMRIVAVDAEPLYGEHYRMADEIRLVDEGLTDLLRRADVLAIAAPRTKRTQGMIGAEQLGQMKRGSYLINVSRGSIVQTPALVTALKDGILAGAGLDVTDPEPLPADHELWSLPNVVITPHTAGQSPLGRQRVQELFAENVRRYANSLPLLNLVNKAAGY